MSPVIIEAICLYWPILTALILGFIFQISRRECLGLLYALLWNLATLPILNGIAERYNWWSFSTTSPSLGGLPLSLWFGWAALWGGAACILTKKWPIWLIVGIAVGIDLLTMPLLQPLLILNKGWLLGETLLLLGALIPGLMLYRWTSFQTRLALRTTLIATGFALLTLVEIALAAHNGDWKNLELVLASRHPALLVALAPLAFAMCIPPILAVREFVIVGKGTPVPMDAPQRLVTTGIYSRIRNPMQFGTIALLFLEALLLWNPWIALSALSILIYSIGFARWSEDEDMQKRFGEDWLDYRRKVPAWRFRKK